MEDQIYVIGSAGSSVAKIGVSNEPERRLQQIQAMSPVLLRVHWHFAGSYALEARLHAYLAAYRTHYEWFDFAGADPVKVVREALRRLEVGEDKLRDHASLTGVEAPVCVCGHKWHRHNTELPKACNVVGWNEWDDCLCETYVPVTASEAFSAQIPGARQPLDLRKLEPVDRVAARQDSRYETVLAEVERLSWSMGRPVVSGDHAEHLAMCIVAALRSRESVTVDMTLTPFTVIAERVVGRLCGDVVDVR